MTFPEQICPLPSCSSLLSSVPLGLSPSTSAQSTRLPTCLLLPVSSTQLFVQPYHLVVLPSVPSLPHPCPLSPLCHLVNFSSFCVTWPIQMSVGAGSRVTCTKGSDGPWLRYMIDLLTHWSVIVCLCVCLSSSPDAPGTSPGEDHVIRVAFI